MLISRRLITGHCALVLWESIQSIKEGTEARVEQGGPGGPGGSGVGSNGRELAYLEQRTGVGLEGPPGPSAVPLPQLCPPGLGQPASQSALSPSCLEFLLDNGADPSLRDRQGYTAVHYAAAYGNRQNLELVCWDLAWEGQQGRAAVDLCACGF